MSSIIKKIKKNVIKLNNALSVLEKHLPKQDNIVSRPFDLLAQINYDSQKNKNDKRKERNKKKSKKSII